MDAATCTVTGTPTTAGDSSFTVRATGPGGSVTKDYTLSVIAPPAVTTVSVPGGVVGVSYTAPVQTTGTGPITCAVTAGLLPPGAALNTNTCTLAGTPTKAGDWKFTITAQPAPTADPAKTAELAETGADPRGPLALSLTMIATGAGALTLSRRQTRVNDG